MRFTALTLSGLALVLFACSSESPTSSTKSPTSAQNQNDDDDDGTPSKPGSTSSPDPSQSSDPTDPAPAGGGQCASQAKAQACFDCCDPSKNAFEAADKAFGDCICAAAKCGTQCAQTACNQANPTEPAQGDACDTCLQANGEACDQTAGDVCDKDANCKKASECVEAAKCFDKPE
jgi:hypothetical protein